MIHLSLSRTFEPTPTYIAGSIKQPIETMELKGACVPLLFHRKGYTHSKAVPLTIGQICRMFWPHSSA